MWTELHTSKLGRGRRHMHPENAPEVLGSELLIKHGWRISHSPLILLETSIYFRNFPSHVWQPANDFPNDFHPFIVDLVDFPKIFPCFSHQNWRTTPVYMSHAAAPAPRQRRASAALPRLLRMICHGLAPKTIIGIIIYIYIFLILPVDAVCCPDINIENVVLPNIW